MDWSTNRCDCTPMLKIGKIPLTIFIASWLLSVVTISLLSLPPHTTLPREICNGDPSNHQQYPATFSFSGNEDNYPAIMLNREINHQFLNYISTSLRDTQYPGIYNYTYYMMARMKLTPLKNVAPVLMNFKPVINDVRSFTYKIDLPGCAPVLDHEISVFVAVISAPNNTLKRDVIRRTWFLELENHLNSINSYSVRSSVVLSGMRFIIGLPDNTHVQNAILAEHMKFGDILQIDFPDTYYNLSVKATALLNWIDRRCHKVNFVFKVDDDVFVNARNLGYLIRHLQPATLDMYGQLSSPVVHRSGKWKMSFEEYPWRSYPPYFVGPAVLLTGTTIQHLLAAAQTIPYHPIDDLFLTGLCTERANIRLVNIERFLDWLEGRTPHPCNLLNAFTWLMDTVEEMKLTYAAMEKFYNGTLECKSNFNISINPIDAVRLISSDILKH